MGSYMQKPLEVERKWYIIDAAGKPLGRVATLAAHLLHGKHKPTYTPHVDCGDQVIIINAEKAVLTGKKLEKKNYITHSGWIGGLKQTQYKTLMATRPEKAMMVAIKGMLPDNTVGRKQLTRVRIYKGENHGQQAQKPEACPFEVK
ncbi:50S ribosomal protein L13 [Clostridia bacterium]|nr:50S ribosomal protein L13 [Clostridia bacterium]